MKNNHISRKYVSLYVLAAMVAIAFAAGLVSARTPFATKINSGLVNAFSSVGENLFGSTVFAARVHPPNPIYPIGAVQLDMADDTQVPIVLNVFAPTDPCRSYLQIAIKGGGVVEIVADYSAVPEGFVFDIPDADLSGLPISSARCTTPPVF